MKKAITIRIPEPCHEDWGKMTTTEQGKFCQVCTKEVFDFTKTTDEELVKKVYNGEKICGRFTTSQINREMRLERKSGFSLAPLAASLLLPFTLLSSTKTEKNTKDNDMFTSLNISSLKRNNTVKIQITTQGKIVDENGKAISNVEILVKETGKNQLSGLKGDYLIKSGNNETLVFKKGGFIIQEVSLGRINSTLDIVFKKEILNIDKQLVGKIAICESSISENKIENKTDSIPKKKLESGKILIGGTVSDDGGLPLPGVNIVVKGTTIGTQTDFDGNYAIELDKGQVLVYSYVGFATEEITSSNINNTVDLQMKEDNSIMGEFVVGYIIVQDDSSRLMGYNNHSSYDSEPSKWRKNAQTSLDNEKEFSRIKRERKKAARKSKKK